MSTRPCFFLSLLDRLSEHIGPFADIPPADHAVQNEGIASRVLFRGFPCCQDGHGAEWLLGIVEEGASHQSLALSMNLCRPCPVGGDEMGLPAKGIIEGFIGGDEEY